MLNLFSTDRDWEIMARGEPFWSVSTWEKFRKQNLNADNLQEFFLTGETYINSLFQMIRTRIDPTFAPQRSLDFGCGVGRVLIPIARRSGSAVGVDVSETMLREARKQIDTFGIKNVQLVKGDDTLSSVEGPIDFVHSVIVFQHIPVQRGEALFAELLKRMKHGSVAAIHFTYAKGFEPVRATWGLRWKKFWKRIGDAFRSLRGNPVMQMNDYSLNVIFRMIQEHGIRRTNVSFPSTTTATTEYCCCSSCAMTITRRSDRCKRAIDGLIYVVRWPRCNAFRRHPRLPWRYDPPLVERLLPTIVCCQYVDSRSILCLAGQ